MLHHNAVPRNPPERKQGEVAEVVAAMPAKSCSAVTDSLLQTPAKSVTHTPLVVTLLLFTNGNS